jgi:hypothetical protein
VAAEHAVFSIDSRLHGEGWRRRSQKKEIHARPILPFLGVRVGEDDTGWALNVVRVIKKWWEA